MSRLEQPTTRYRNEVYPNYSGEIGQIEPIIVHVDDPSDSSPTREKTTAKIEAFDTFLREHPELSAPSWQKNPDGSVSEFCYNNDAAKEMFTSMPALDAWRKNLVPSAIALYSLQFPNEKYLPLLNGVEIDEGTREFFTDSLDARGIRTRAKVMADIAETYVKDGGNWVSLACGAAVPVLETIERSTAISSAKTKLTLVDMDETALNFASAFASHKNIIGEENVTTKRSNLIKSMIASDNLVDELGHASADFVDALGIFEYFDDKNAATFLRNTYNLVAPGGATVIANMLDTHPQLAFNQRAIGWPKIFPRSLKEVEEIVTAAGIDLSSVSITIPNDQIYAVFEIKKPAA